MLNKIIMIKGVVLNESFWGYKTAFNDEFTKFLYLYIRNLKLNLKIKFNR